MQKHTYPHKCVICVKEQQTRAQCSTTLSGSMEQHSRPPKTSALCRYLRVILHRVKSEGRNSPTQGTGEKSKDTSYELFVKRCHFTQLKIKTKMMSVYSDMWKWLDYLQFQRPSSHRPVIQSVEKPLHSTKGICSYSQPKRIPTCKPICKCTATLE